jgi:hypothetical protein
LSLVVSYWVNGFLGNILAFLIVFGIKSLLVNFESNFTPAVLNTGIWTFVLGFATWQSVGIWRSADQYSLETKRTGWALLARIVVVLSAARVGVGFVGQGLPAISDGFKQAIWLQRNAKWNVRVLSLGTELELSGGIGYGLTEELRRSLDAHKTVRVVRLNLSEGGLIDEAKRASALIRSRGLSTYVSSSCVSACTILFLGGRERYLESRAKLGFHASKIAGLYGPNRLEALASEQQYLISLGVSQPFASRVVHTPTEEMWYPPKEDLLSSGVVTAIIDGSSSEAYDRGVKTEIP